MRLLYVMDPMCAWCYGFQPELEQFLANHPGIEVEWIMGGLAPDSSEPMAQSLRDTISSYWYHIEQNTQVTFNHTYWKLNTPYRSTYQACRAVIAAKSLSAHAVMPMVKAIQSAYYQEAKNPSLDDTLVDCADSLGIDKARFTDRLNAGVTEECLQRELMLTQQLQIRGFPALIYVNEQNQAFPLTLGFCQANDLEQRFSEFNS